MQKRFWNLVWLGYLILQHLWCCQHLSWNWEQKTSLHWRLDRGHKLPELLRTDDCVYNVPHFLNCLHTNLWRDSFGGVASHRRLCIQRSSFFEFSSHESVKRFLWWTVQQFSNWTEGGTARKRRNMRSQCCIPGKLWPPQTCPISNVKCQNTLWSAFSCASAWSINFHDTMVWRSHLQLLPDQPAVIQMMMDTCHTRGRVVAVCGPPQVRYPAMRMILNQFVESTSSMPSNQQLLTSRSFNVWPLAGPEAQHPANPGPLQNTNKKLKWV